MEIAMARKANSHLTFRRWPAEHRLYFQASEIVEEGILAETIRSEIQL